MSVTIASDMYEAAQIYGQDEGARFMYALVEYAEMGQEPDTSEVWYPTFLVLRERISLSATAHENGRRGGRPTKPQKKEVNNLNEKGVTNPNQEEVNNLNTEGVYNPDDDEVNNLNDEGVKNLNHENAKTLIRIDKDSKGKDSKRFYAPSLEEVQAYAREKNLSEIEAQRFIEYYGTQGWKKANGQKLTNWRLAFSGWCARNGTNEVSNKYSKLVV